VEGVYVLIKMKRVCYKIFNNEEDLKVYLDKNKDKSCTGNKSIYASNLSNNTLVGEVKILSKEEVDKYLKEQSAK
jgi:cell division protein FtsX